MQDWHTFQFQDHAMRTPELADIENLYNNNDDFVRADVDKLPMIFMSDIATAQAAPALFAQFINVTTDAFLHPPKPTVEYKSTSTPEDHKRTREEEAAIIEAAGATEIYQQLYDEMTERIRMNYILFGIGMNCVET